MSEDINFRLNTEANTEGAEAMEDALKKTGEAAEDAGKKSAKLETNDSEANLRGRAVQWVKVGEALKTYGAAAAKAAGDMEGLDENTKALVKSAGESAEAVGGVVSSVAQGFAAGGPLGAVVAGATAGLGIFLKVYQDTNAAVNDSDAAAKRAVDTWKMLQDLKKNLPLVQGLEEVNRLLDAELAKLVRNQRVRQSTNRADSAEGQEANSAAVAAGTKTQGQADASNLSLGFQQQAAAIVEALRIATQEQATIVSEAEKLKVSADKGVLTEGFATLDAQLKAAEKKQLEVVAGAKRLEDTGKIAEEQLRELAAKSKGTAREIGEAGLEALTEVATKERDALKTEVDRLGANASSGARATLAILDEILKSNGIQADEVARYNQSIGQLNRQQELGNKAVLEAFEEGRKLSAAYGTEILGVKRDLALQAASFRQEIDRLKQQSQSNQSGY